MHEMDQDVAHGQTSAMDRALCLGFLVLAFSMGAQPVLAAGDIDVLTSQITEEGSSISSGQATIVIDKPLDAVLPVVVDYDNYVHFMPNFTKSKVLAQRGHRAMVYMEVSVASGTLTLWGQLKLAECPSEGDTRIIEARLLDGNIDAFHATWRLTPIEDGARTEVEFTLYVDPDMPLPSSVFSRENERAAGNTLRALRSRLIETAEPS